MLESLRSLIESLTPLLVAMTTAYGAVLVAKVTKVQKDIKTNVAKVAEVQRDIKTNHGSKNLGDAIDRLTTKVEVIGDNQDALIETVKGMQLRDEALEGRMNAVDRANRQRTDRPVQITGQVAVRKTPRFKWRRNR